VCRRCGSVLLAADVRAEELLDPRLRKLKRRVRAPSTPDLTGRRDVALALADMEAAARQLDEAVVGIDKRHSPLGCLPFVLALVTGVVIVGVTATSIRWYFSALLSFGGAAVMFAVLVVFRLVSWSRHHPLLARMYTLRHTRREETGGDEFLELGEAIVRKYLPETESESLVARLEEASARTALLLGLDDEEPEPRGHAEA